MSSPINKKETGESPPAFHVMVKPAGASCNLNCSYCFYLSKQSLYPESNLQMTDEVLDSYLNQLISAHRTPRVTVAWQGGEPTLMGLEFFRRVVELEKHYAKPGTTIENTIQTNGTLLNEEWCKLLRENNFLVGISIDGPKNLHDTCRKDRVGQGSFDRVIKGLRLLQEHGVEYNILATVNRYNAEYPLEVYKFFRDELHAEYIQFIPIVETRPDGGVTKETLRLGQWGRLLIEIFEEWVTRDVGTTFVLNFDGILAGWLGLAGTLCVFGRTCGLGLALEHNGDLYSCDHYVRPEYKLGNIMDTPLIEMVSSSKQRKFGKDKWDSLPAYCRRCEFLSLCYGECPKNRILNTPDGEAGLNYLCSDYRAFFEHSSHLMRKMAMLLQKGHLASDILTLASDDDENKIQ